MFLLMEFDGNRLIEYFFIVFIILLFNVIFSPHDISFITKQFDNVDYDYTTYDERNTDRRNQPDQRRNQHSYNNFNQAGANRKLRLVWEERGKSLTYLLRVDSARRGFWISSGQQKGEGENMTKFL